MRTCPEWFQKELTRIGGKNPYGEPMFKLVWSPYGTDGHWRQMGLRL